MHEGMVHNNTSKIKGISKLLVIIGALNWGLVGLLSLDLVALLFGKKSTVSKLVYILVGLSGAYLLMTHKEKFSGLKKHWHKKGEKKYSGKQYSWSGIQ
ncbi:MAG: uncharacterized protein QG610_2510 [Euryarchaeota archaeon]|nr:uncharacterized protein [Euryarchaeota archaeon]